MLAVDGFGQGRTRRSAAWKNTKPFQKYEHGENKKKRSGEGLGVVGARRKWRISPAVVAELRGVHEQPGGSQAVIFVANERGWRGAYEGVHGRGDRGLKRPN